MYRSNPYLQGSEGPTEREWNTSYNHPPQKEDPLKSFHHNPYDAWNMFDANKDYNQIPLTEPPTQNDVAEEPSTTVEVAPQRPKEEDLNDYRQGCRILVLNGRFPRRLVSNVDGAVTDNQIAQVMRLHNPNHNDWSSVMSRRNPYRNHPPQKEAALTVDIKKDNEALHKNLQHVTNVANEAYRRLPVAKEEVPNSSALNGYRKDCCILVITGLPIGVVSNVDGTVTDNHIARVMDFLSQIETTRMKQRKEGPSEWKVKLHKMSDNPGKDSKRLTAPFRRGNERDGKKSALPPFQLRGEIGRPMIFTLCGKDDLEALLSLNGSIWYNPLHERIEIGQFAAGLEPLTLEAGNASK